MKHALLSALFLSFFSAACFSKEPPLFSVCGECQSAAQILESNQKIWLMSCGPEAEAFVFDSKGGLVENFKLSEGENFFDCKELETGIYIAILTEKDGTSATFSISKN